MVTERKKSLSEQIVENRRKLEQKFAKKYVVSEPALAEFFQVPIKVITRDFEAAKISINSELEVFPFEKQKRLLYNRATNLEKRGLPREEALAECGFWTEATMFTKENGDLFQGFEAFQILRMQKAVALSEYGYTKDDIKKMVPGVTKVEMDFMKADAAKKGVVFGKDSKNHYIDFAKDRHAKGDLTCDIKEAVGVAETLLIKTNYSEYRQKAAESYHKHMIKTGKIQEITSKEQKSTKKEDCFQKWQQEGYTQDELAKLYGVTRATIVNWLREMKTIHFEEMDISVVRRRNLGSEKTEKRNNEKSYYLEIAAEKIQKGMSPTQISLQYKLNLNKLIKYLREDGLICTKFEDKARGLNAVQKTEEFQSKLNYHINKVNSLFGYGPNAGATVLLGAAGHGRLNSNMKETGYELKYQEKARDHFMENDGNMTDYWLEKHVEKDLQKQQVEVEGPERE